ncbi:MAG TPA: TlpA disulfide reductase family protein [Bacillales bacterium]|nr:TlpA disulfide reductase family protein [Bacillales bacterium]
MKGVNNMAKKKKKELEHAPSFSLIEIGTNREVSLDDLQGKFVILTFWVSWCPDCHRDLPKKQTLYEAQQQNKDLAFLTINVTGREGDPDDGIRFLDSQDFTFPVLRDQELTVYDSYGCDSVPYTVLLNRKHEIVKRFDDRSSFIEIALALDELMKKDSKDQES